MQNAVMRERMFTMRLSEEESHRLDRLAAHHGLNGAGLIRMLLKREERALATELSKESPTMTQDGCYDAIVEQVAYYEKDTGTPMPKANLKRWAQGVAGFSATFTLEYALQRLELVQHRLSRKGTGFSIAKPRR